MQLKIIILSYHGLKALKKNTFFCCKITDFRNYIPNCGMY